MNSAQIPSGDSTAHRRAGRRALALVMLLPLLDGVFPALLIAGALSSPIGIIQVGLLVFGGGGTAAVLLAGVEGSTRHRVRTVMVVAIPVILGAMLSALFAPTLASGLRSAVFERVAALVLLLLAIQTANPALGARLPRPGIVVLVGALASVQPGRISLDVSVDPSLILAAGASAVIGVTFALTLAIFGPACTRRLVMERFTVGAALAMALLGMSLLGVVPEASALVALGLATVLAIDPSHSTPGEGFDDDRRGAASVR